LDFFDGILTSLGMTASCWIGHLWASDVILGHMSTYWIYYNFCFAVSAEAVAAFTRAVAAFVEAVVDIFG